MAANSMTRKRGGLVLGLAWLVVVAVLAGTAAFVQFRGNPFDGQKIISIDVQPLKIARVAPKPAPPPPPPEPPAPALLETPPGGIVPAVISPEEQAAMAAPPPAQTATPPPTPTAAQTPAPAQTPAAPATPENPPLPPVILPPLIGGALVANPAVLEKTPQGYLPRVSDTGTTPMQAYSVPLAAGNRPRVAIVIGGLGISARSTDAAIKILPPGVTLAFVPYANDVQHWVAAARQKGHEVLVQVPMEPYDFPDSDPGQYTLRTGTGEEANTKRLAWSLTRITGYVGVTNFLGARYLTDAAALEPTLTFVMRRGLLFYDNGAATRSVAPEVAGRLGMPFAQASITIDSIQAALEIDHRLADLETEARSKGAAAGTGRLYPVTVERVNLWARGLASRGLVLAPISAVVSKK